MAGQFPGGLLAGRYRPVRELGRGASGRVLLAHDTAEADRPRALKLVGPAEVARLGWEFERLRQVVHPGLAAVHDLLSVSGQPDAVAALVMDYAQGRPADQVLAETAGQGPRLARALPIAEQVARALAAIHAQGLVHGDVKTQNILVDPAGHATLIDLGLARPSAFEQTLSGTPGYMAPELLRGELTPSADLFALGVTLSRLLAGSRLEEPTVTRPTPEVRGLLSPLLDELPAGLQTLLQELLADAPEQRPVSALRVAQRLHALSAPDAAGPVEAALPEPSPQERALRVLNLPAVGQADALAALRVAGTGGVVIVHGPDGSGRSRLVRQYVGELQRTRLATGQRAPSYRAVTELPELAPGDDTVLHLLPGADVDAPALSRLVRAARIGGAELTVLWERALPPGPQDVDCDAVGVAPLAEAELAELLGGAIEERAPSAALQREAMAASGGLAGRLCRLLAFGAREGLHVWTGQRLRQCAAGIGAGQAPLPESARPLAELLAVAGGALAFEAVVDALPTCAAQAESLRALGLVSLDVQAGPAAQAALRLRPDLQGPLLEALPMAQRLRRIGMLLDARLSARARCYVAAAGGDAAAAGRLLLGALSECRAVGEPDAAAELAASIDALLPGGVDVAGRVAWADALRAQARYGLALKVLGDAEGRDALALGAELLRLRGERDAAQALIGPAPDSPALAAVAARLAFDAGELGRAAAQAGAILGADADPLACLRAREVAGLCGLYEGTPAAGLSTAADGIAQARAAGLRVEEARLSAVAAMCAGALGQRSTAVGHWERAAALASAAGEAHAGATYLMNLATEDIDAGDLGRALTSLRQAALGLTRLGREREVARALYNLAHLRALCGDHTGARTAARHGAEAAARAGDRAAELLASGLAAELGDDAEARAWLASLPDTSGLPSAEGGMIAVRAVELALRLGETAEAQVLDGALQARVDEHSQPALRVEAALVHGRCVLASGDAAAALALATRAHAEATESGGFELGLRSALLAAECARAAGAHAEAAARFAEVRSRLDAAARGLSLQERLRLRRVAAYRAAWEASPALLGGGAATTGASSPVAAAGHADALLGWAKRFMAERRPARLAELVVDCALELSGAERGCLLRLDADGAPRARAARGLSGDEVVGDGPGLSSSVVHRVLSTAQPMSTVDAMQDTRLSEARSVHALSLRSVAAVPLLQAGEVTGAIYVEDRLRPFAFREGEMSALRDLAQLAAIAFEGVAMLRAQRRATRRLSATRAKLARQLELQSTELQVLKRQAPRRSRGDLVGSGPAMQRLFELIERVAPADVPVLITGESGTGKELTARALHAESGRSAAPFVSENCAAIPEPLLESALFGHERGAFTGADRRRVGLFEAADGGTLFLDEVGEMSPAMQTRLLRVLEDGQVRPVGGERARRVDVRVVAATHRDLETMVRDGSFRQDLYYRLAVVGLDIPPLRARADDIPELVRAFVRKHAGDTPVRVPAETLRTLQSLPWPGNVRQLENEVRRALVLSDGEIRPGHLSPQLQQLADGAAGCDGNLRSQIDRLERRLIREALQSHEGNQTRAARALGVSRFGLQKMIKRLELN